MRPGKATVASTHARGTPKSAESAVAASEHSIERRSAWPTAWLVSTDHADPHGTRHSSPMNGRAKKATATAASTTASNGGARRFSAAPPGGRRGRPPGGRRGRTVRQGAPKPYSARIAWPSWHRTNDSNAAAPSALAAVAGTAIG